MTAKVFALWRLSFVLRAERKDRSHALGGSAASGLDGLPRRPRNFQRKGAFSARVDMLQ